MATRKKSESEQELMTDANIAKVIRLLNPTEEGVKPWTKKEACAALGMAYNTTRLASIIENYQNKIELERRRRAEKRGTAVTDDEVSYAITEYLSGESVDGIAKSLYRSSSFVKKILEDNAVPIRAASHDYFKPVLIPEGAVRDRFKVGEIVYSARYDSTARIEAEIKEDSRHGWVYRLWLLSDKWKQYCYQEACELASLEHLREKGIKV